MQFESLNPTKNRAKILRKSTSSNLNNESPKKNEIQQGMTPEEIADIVSDHLIEVVRKQFEAKRRELHSMAQQ